MSQCNASNVCGVNSIRRWIRNVQLAFLKEGKWRDRQRLGADSREPRCGRRKHIDAARGGRALLGRGGCGAEKSPSGRTASLTRRKMFKAPIRSVSCRRTVRVGIKSFTSSWPWQRPLKTVAIRAIRCCRYTLWNSVENVCVCDRFEEVLKQEAFFMSSTSSVKTRHWRMKTSGR